MTYVTARASNRRVAIASLFSGCERAFRWGQ